jgi:ribosomal protein S12 methylthiotransferase accessory factor
MLFSENQYQSRRGLNNRQFHACNWVPDPLNQDDDIEWTPVWSLTNRQLRYLPTSYCYYYYSLHGALYCWADSNGNAAGNTLEEAILQGLLELVERDSVALWWYNRVRRPRVDLKYFDEPYIRGLMKYLGTLGRDLWVLDLSTDLTIPVFAAVSRRNDPNEEIALGFGAHLDPRVGVLRALTELNQFLVGASLYYKRIDHNSDDIGVDDAFFHDWFTTATLANQPYLVPDESAQSTQYSSYASCSEDVRESVFRCQEIIERQGMEVLVLNQTRPDIGLPVTKVIVPGLRPFWARFAPGRLYDVPVMLGWHQRQLTESQLNPVHMFL